MQDQQDQDQSQDFTEEEFLQEMRDFVVRLEAQDASIKEVRRQHILDQIKNDLGIEIVHIEKNVIFFKRVKYNEFMFVR